MVKRKVSFHEQCQRIYALVEKANNDPRARRWHSDGRLRFSFFTETNTKGLFAFGIYDYASKKVEIVDVFDNELESRVKYMKDILNTFPERRVNA